MAKKPFKLNASSIISGRHGRFEAQNDSHCEGCSYYAKLSTYKQKVCNYLMWTGHMRGCPPGEGCEKYTKDKAIQAKGWQYD